MVTILNTSSTLRGSFRYNENKLEVGKAELISVQNYPGNSVGLSPEMKLKYLQKLAGLNSRTKVNAIHVSMNFAPGEQLEKEKLIEISKEYMKGIDFGDQPYLVYQHTDAGHPHLHIVSTNIQLGGTRIPLHNIENSSQNRPERQLKSNLVWFGQRIRNNLFIWQKKKIELARVYYGKTETKRAIGNVLQHVLKNYHYTSLPELNAVMKGYNVVADRGGEGSRIYQNRGLVYRVLYEKGEKVGVPIKASLFRFKATLDAVESRFVSHENARKPHLSVLKSAIDLTLLKAPKMGLDDLIQKLERQGIVLVKRENQQGRVYGLTYVDHRTRCVFNGSALGKSYSSKGMMERLEGIESHGLATRKVALDQGTGVNCRFQVTQNTKDSGAVNTYDLIQISSPLEAVVKAEETQSHLPFDWRKRKKRKEKTYLTRREECYGNADRRE